MKLECKVKLEEAVKRRNMYISLVILLEQWTFISAYISTQYHNFRYIYFLLFYRHIDMHRHCTNYSLYSTGWWSQRRRFLQASGSALPIASGAGEAGYITHHNRGSSGLARHHQSPPTPTDLLVT